MNRKQHIDELSKRFSDLINYEADDPTTPIDPYSYRTPEGDSCLHIAAMRGDCIAIDLLLNDGVDINAIGDMGNTALHYASRGQQRQAFQLLVSRGANQSIKNDFGKIPEEP